MLAILGYRIYEQCKVLKDDMKWNMQIFPRFVVKELGRKQLSEKSQCFVYICLALAFLATRHKLVPPTTSSASANPLKQISAGSKTM